MKWRKGGRKVRAEFHNDWKSNRKRFRFFDLQLNLALFQISFIMVEIVLYYNPLGYDIALGILGFSICLWNAEYQVFEYGGKK